MLVSAKKGVIESPKSKRPKAKQQVPVATFESDSSESEHYRPFKIIPARLPVEVSARHEEIAAGQGPSSSRLVLEHGAGAKAKPKTTKAKRGKGSQDRPALVARECLTNSSQEEDVESGSQSESSGTRKSPRRRKPVDKTRGVMIDSIQGVKKKGKYPGEGNK